MSCKTVLLIDDSPEYRAKLKAQLTEAHHQVTVHEAPNGSEGITLVRTVNPDCVVMELKLEDLVGTEAINLIQSEMNGQSAPIFVWTSLQHDMLRHAAMSLGTRGYFLKSSDSEHHVAQAVLEVLAIR